MISPTAIACAIALPSSVCVLAVLQDGVSAADVKEMTAFAALLLMVFTIGWQQVKATREVKPELASVRDALLASTAAQKDATQAQRETGAALQRYCDQQAAANTTTLRSQQELADRNLRETTQELAAMRLSLVELRAAVSSLGDLLRNDDARHGGSN